VPKSKLTTPEIVSLRRDGLKLREISERAGIHIRSVCARLFSEKPHPREDVKLRTRETSRKWFENNQTETFRTATSHYDDWTDEDKEFLTTNRILMTSVQLATALKRTLGSIQWMTRVLKISLKN